MNSSHSRKFETLWKSFVESFATFAKKVLRIYLVAIKLIAYFLKTGSMFESSLFSCIGNLNDWEDL